MAAKSINADNIIEEIDAGCLQPALQKVVRVFHQFIRIEDELQGKALAAFDRGETPEELALLQRQIWAKIDKLDPAQQSGLRLSICLTGPDGPVDWHLAEYLILWARQQGLSEQQIIDAFHGT
ncbi:hypothetical protein [Novosphingobium naphthalenivorans]|uniref:hypothetical protein n=1 Tax=Novosphingobium naphthalenivorans TaxID=273168 RepID=UPI00082C700A|nr:hypothetical protein [Novosphingobium naphthalenivorans]